MNQGNFYFLRRKNDLVVKRIRREKQSKNYFRKAKILCQTLKLIPWIKMVGVSGALAMENAGKRDDIDLLIVTSKNRLWISRLLALGLLSLAGQRRKRGETGRKIAGKLCINILLEEDKLEQKNKDIFVAHEVLQMRPLWRRDGVYSKYLADNEWAFKFLPNWIDNSSDLSLRGRRGDRGNLDLIGIVSSFSLLVMTRIENLAKWLQLKIMREPQGMERIEDGALYFLPEDCRLEVLSKYKSKIFSTLLLNNSHNHNNV